MFEEFIFSRKGGCKRWLYVFAGLLPQRAARGLPEPRAVRMGGDGSVGPAVKEDVSGGTVWWSGVRERSWSKLMRFFPLGLFQGNL